MSAMIERVALSIYKELPNGKGVKDPIYMKVARAAIQAMREPTKEMQDAGFNGFIPWNVVWYRMIDAALKE